MGVGGPWRVYELCSEVQSDPNVYTRGFFRFIWKNEKCFGATLPNRYNMRPKRTQPCISWFLFSTHISHRVCSLRELHFKAWHVLWIAITLQGRYWAYRFWVVVVVVVVAYVCARREGGGCPISPSTSRYQSELWQWGSLVLRAPFHTGDKAWSRESASY